jgi:hypothetical protein
MNPLPHHEPELVINPTELFNFLARHDQYPVSGLRLAELARQEDAAPELTDFFERLPGALESESQIVSLAVRPDVIPDATLDLEGGKPTPPEIAPEDATLQISDIVPDDPA